MPWKLIGCTTADGVTKVRSTTSGVDEGLNNATYMSSEPDVVPLGKYHCREVSLRQGACDHPDGPWTNWVTATPPPVMITDWETHEPAVVGVPSTACLRAGTETGVATVAPLSETDVTVPATGRVLVLVRSSDPTATCSEAVDCPVQYQADDSAAVALTMAPGAGGGPLGGFDTVERATMAPPTTTTRTTTTTSQRLGSLCAPGLTWAPVPVTNPVPVTARA